MSEDFTTNVKEGKATLTVIKIKSKGNRGLETQRWGNTVVYLAFLKGTGMAPYFFLRVGFIRHIRQLGNIQLELSAYL